MKTGLQLPRVGARTKAMIRFGALIAVAVATTLALANHVAADPSFGVDPASPSGPPGSILEPAPGAPQLGPLPAPMTTIAAGALGLPVGSNVDGLSYGDDAFPPAGPWHLTFSVAPGSMGHPGSPPISPMQPNVFAELIAGDGSVAGDIYSSFEMTGVVPGTFGAYAFAAPPPAPCGPIHSNIQVADENGMGPLAMGFPNVGLGLTPADNLDALEMLDNTFVDLLPPGGDGIPDAPVFFSVDPATAGLLPPLPPFFGVTTAADVLVWDPGTLTLYDWAPAGALGLVPGDDIDALTVGYVSGVPFAGGWVGAPDVILLSLAPGSPSLAGVLPSFCFGPATGTAGDIYAAFAVGGPLFPAVDAEMLGLSTLRSGGFGNDNVDAIDLILASAVDGDGDLLDDDVDMDDDNDGLGDMRDAAAGCSPVMADTDGDGLSDYTEVVTYGTNCAVPDTDGDGCTDNREVQTAPGSQMLGGLRNPLNPNDYFNPSGDLINRVDDILMVVAQYHKDDTDGNPGLPPYAPGYTPTTDRTSKGPDLWRTGPPNGQQRVDDILNSVYQYHHDCV